MAKIADLGLVATHGVLGEVWQKTFGEADVPFSVGDIMQEAYYAGALATITQMTDIAASDEAKMATVRQKLKQFRSEIGRFDELRHGEVGTNAD